MANGAPGGCRDRRNALYTMHGYNPYSERAAEAQVVVRVRLVRRFTLYVARRRNRFGRRGRCGSPRWPRSSRWCRPAVQRRDLDVEEVAIVVDVSVGRTEDVKAASERVADRCADSRIDEERLKLRVRVGEVAPVTPAERVEPSSV